MDAWVETFLPARVYSRSGWATAASCIIFGALGFRSPEFLIPIAVLAPVSLVLLWLGTRPPIQIQETQIGIGERVVVWREIEAINRVKISLPLILRFKLTNARRLLLIYPGKMEKIDYLVEVIRKCSHLATFDGVAYKDQWNWSATLGTGETKASVVPDPVVEAPKSTAAGPPPIRMLSEEEENEIERMFQKLKTVGSLDIRIEPAKSDED